jgi:hypothetical protein
MRQISRLSECQIINAMIRIQRHFDRYAASDPFGWDWPTMKIVFPELCDRYFALKAEGISRIKKGTWNVPHSS